jgi:hypothetical protein
MLQMRPGCECCDQDLPADAPGAMICSFECTFCEACARDVLGGACPNCGGGLVARPMRASELLARFPPVSERTVKAGGCPVKA